MMDTRCGNPSSSNFVSADEGWREGRRARKGESERESGEGRGREHVWYENGWTASCFYAIQVFVSLSYIYIYIYNLSILPPLPLSLPPSLPSSPLSLPTCPKPVAVLVDIVGAAPVAAAAVGIA